jgi:hypothetical protein
MKSFFYNNVSTVNEYKDCKKNGRDLFNTDTQPDY